MNEFAVRALEPEDSEAIRAIYNWAVANTTATMDTSSREDVAQKAWMAMHLSPSRYPAFVAVCDGQVIGYASLSPYIARDGYRLTAETSVYVHPDFHGRGVGKGLLSVVVQQADKLGFVSLLALVSADNAASIYLHEWHDFKSTGFLRSVGRKFGQWVDVIILQRVVHQRTGEE